MKRKTIGWIIAMSVLAASSWGAMKWDMVDSRRELADHGEQLKVIGQRLSVIETDARATREGIADAKWEQKLTNQRIDNSTAQINQKLDYLTGDRRGPRPASGTTSQ